MRVSAVRLAVVMMRTVAMRAEPLDRPERQSEVAMGTRAMVLVPPEPVSMFDRVMHPTNLRPDGARRSSLSPALRSGRSALPPAASKDQP